uniref:Evasin n=1 Tax=Rhipicephalus pulchellus TaxID=72859 RepID=L7M220_RHIPC
MVRLFSWVVFFAIFGCSRGNADTSYGLTPCIRLPVNTSAGTKYIGCHHVRCPPESTMSQTNLCGRECVALLSGASNYMKIGVNYKCRLGECNEANKCITFDLFIDCWRYIEKPSIDTP